MMKLLSMAAVLLLAPAAALAGPPYLTDDPEPTDTGHYEIYLFHDGVAARGGWAGSAGVDFNYGGARDLQLTASVPLSWDAPDHGAVQRGLGNVQLAAKYRFLHQADTGVDVAVFPRVFLPAGSAAVGPRNTALLLPLWIQYSTGPWTAFGGGGCALNRGGGQQDYCLTGGVLTRQIRPDLQLGIELYHQSADTKGGRDSTDLGFGVIYDLGEHLHLMASGGPGLSHPRVTAEAQWYASLLVTL